MPSYEKVIDIYNSMEKLKSKLDTTEKRTRELEKFSWENFTE